MLKMLSYLRWLRYAFVPLLFFLCLAIAGLVLKASAYVSSIFAEIMTESVGRLIHYSLGLVDVILVVGLMFLMVRYVLFTFVLVSAEETESLPTWFRDRASGYDDRSLKIKVAGTILLIATIDLLGEFVELATADPASFDVNPDRLWMLLALHGALVITALALTFTAWLIAKPSAANLQ